MVGYNCGVIFLGFKISHNRGGFKKGTLSFFDNKTPNPQRDKEIYIRNIP